MFFWEYVDGLWATKSEGVGLIVRAINFQDFQPDRAVKTTSKRVHCARRLNKLFCFKFKLRQFR